MARDEVRQLALPKPLLPFVEGLDAFCFGGPTFFGFLASLLPLCWPLAMLTISMKIARKLMTAAPGLPAAFS